MKYELDSSQWLQKQLAKVTKNDYRRTFYAVAHLSRLHDDQVVETRSIIVPVDVYEHKDPVGSIIGFEIISVKYVASMCPWDMTKTRIDCDTGCTRIHDNLHDCVVENAELFKHIEELRK